MPGEQATVIIDPSGTPYDITSFVEKVETWGETRTVIGRFAITLRRDSNLDLTKITADKEIQIKVNAAIIMTGYLDKGGRGAASTPISTHLKTYTIRGRNYGQDCGNKMIFNKTYIKQLACSQLLKDAVDSYTELTLNFDAAGPSMSRIIKDKYVSELLKHVLEKIDYDVFTHADAKEVTVFPSGSRNSNITLKAIAADATNNILNLTRGDFDTFDLRNYIIARGRTINDGITEGNASDYTNPEGTIHDETTIVKVGGASIKAVGSATGAPLPTLTLPKFNYNSFDFSIMREGIISVWLYQTTDSPNTRRAYIYLTDDSGNKIGYYDNAWELPHQEWKSVSAPVGANIEIGGSWESGKWTFLTGSSFTWKITKIEFEFNAPFNTDSILYFDGLAMPIDMYAIAQDATSQSTYKKRDLVINGRNAYTQEELQLLVDSALTKRKDPMLSIRVTAKGIVGISGSVSVWLPGYRLVVNSPDDGISSQTFTMLRIHQVISKNPVSHGFNYVVYLDLIEYGSGEFDMQRWLNVEDPKLALLHDQQSKIRDIERIISDPMDLGARFGTPIIVDSMIPDGADIDGSKLKDISVDTAKIVDAAIETAKIADLAVVTAKIDNLAVTVGKIDNLAVTEAKIANLAVTNAKIALLAVDTANIIDAAIETAKINNLAVTTGKIDDLAVTTAKIGALQVTRAKIANAAIDTLQLNDLAVTNLKIANNTIEFTKVVDVFGRDSYFAHDRLLVTIESLTGYNYPSPSGSGSVSTRKNNVLLSTGTTNFSDAQIYSFAIVQFSYNPEMKARVHINWGFGDGVGEAWLLIGYPTTDSFGFVFDGGYIKAYWRNSSTHFQNLIVATGGNWYILKAVMDYGTNIKFYVDNVLRHTATTDLPTAGPIEDFYAYIFNSNSGADRQMIISYYTCQEDWQ